MTPLAAEVNENLAQISNYLVYSSMAVYMLAFFAHIAEWTFGSRSKVGRTAAALTATKAAEAGAADAPAVQVRGKGARPSSTSRRSSRAPPAAPATSRTAPARPHGHRERRPVRPIAVSLTALGFLIEAGGVVTRAMSVQRAPWGNMYEFSVTFSAVAVGAYLLLLALKKNVRWLGLILVTTVLLDLGIATTWLYTDSDQLVPALHSYWLWIHVSTAIFCGAVFYIGAAGAVLYLFRDSYESHLEQGRTPGRFRSSVLERLPSAASLDKFSYRINAAVFPLWTFTIVAGAIWAGDAWGRYWGWDPKEVWSFVTWVAYACYLHARATAGWKGRKAAYLALFAFACWIWNYYGVNILLSGKHSYAGV